MSQRYKDSYYEQLCTKKISNPEEMDEFLETCNLPSLNHEKKRKSEQSNYYLEDWSNNQKPPTKKSPGLDGFTG